MRTDRTGYLMAMLAGLAIVGASTGGVVIATSHHKDTLAADAAASAAARTSTSAAPGSTADPGAVSAPSSTPAVVSESPAGAPTTPAGAPTSGPVASAPTSPGPTTAPSSPAATSPSPTTAPSTAPTSRASTSTPSTAAAQFKDGTYSATGSYNSPGGIEKLGVTLTIAADKVTKSDLDLLGGTGLSHTFQEAFASGYSDLVVGKDISSLSLGAVAGSSLTGMGFNDAVKQIESQARSQR